MIARADKSLGSWRFECVEASPGDLCGVEGELIRLLGLTGTEWGSTRRRSTST